MIRIRLSCNDITGENHGNDNQPSNTKSSRKKTAKCDSQYDPFAVTLVVKNSNLKISRTVLIEETSFLRFSAEDFSLYELSGGDGYNLSGGKGCLNSDANDLRHENSRSKQSYETDEISPFLFGTTFHRSSVTTDDDQAPSDSTRYHNEDLKSVKQNVPILLFQICLTEEMKKYSKEKTKKVSVFIDVNNVTHKHNPSSNFIRNITYLLTPCSPSEIMRNRAVNLIMKENNMKSEINHLSAMQVVPQTAVSVVERKSSVDISQSPLKTVKITEPYSLVFAMTKINIRLRKCFIDYVCPAVKSRVFLSIGSASLSTAIANNSNGYLLKFAAKDLVLHLSNQIIQNPLYEQNPLDMNGNRPQRHTPNTNMYMKSSMTHNYYPKQDNVSDPFKSQNRKTNSTIFVLDFDRFLDEHNFIQLVTIDDLNFLASMNLFKPRVLAAVANAGEGDTHSLFSAVECSGDAAEKVEADKDKVEEASCAPSMNQSVDRSDSYKAIPIAHTVEAVRTAPDTAQTVRTSDVRASPSPSNSSVSVEISMGLFCVYVCVDSVDVLTVRMISRVCVNINFHFTSFSVMSYHITVYFPSP
jgi:hypothetical protein